MSKSEKYELKSVEPKKKKYGSLDQGVSSSMTHILPNDSLEQELEDGAATERTHLLPAQRDGSFTDFLQTLQKVPLSRDRSRAVSFDPADFTTPEAVRRTAAADYSRSASFDEAVSSRWSETRPLLAPPSITQRRSRLVSSSFHDRRRSQALSILDTGDAREPQQESTGGLQATLKSWLCGPHSVQREESADDLARFAFDPASCVDPEAVLRGAARERERQKTLTSSLDVTQRPSKGAGDPQNHNNEYNLERRKGAQLPAEMDSCFFRDERRRIDYILVYEDTGILGKVRGRLAEKRFLKQEAWRGRFRANLRRAGLQMEEEIVPGSKKTIYFIKLHAPWDVLCTWAEELKMKAPLQPLYHLVRDRVTPRKSIGPRYRDGFLDSVTRLRVQDQLRMTSIQMSPKMELFLARIQKDANSCQDVRPNMPHNWSEWILKKLHIPNIMQQDVPNKPVEYFTCPFKKAKVDKFLGSQDQDHYFSTSQRIRIVYELLATSVFGKRKQGEVGIERLVDDGTYNAAFPLHDGEYEIPKGTDVPPSEMNARQVLYEYWGRYTRWYKYQPLDHIREYFGEKIGIYFAWLGFYTGWLLPAAVVGFLVFLYGVITIDTNDVANEICAKAGQFKMCPLCDYCKYWDLHTICAYAKIAYLFDHPGTVFYSVFVSFWAITFLEYWKRKCATLAHHWDCMDYQEEEERPRPDFAARAPSYGKNPITGVREPTFPHRVRLKRIAAGVGIIILMMSLVIIFIVAVIIYRVLVSIPLFQNPTFQSQAQAISSLSGAIVNLILIMCMGRVYEKLAYRLTVWEMHRTQSEFEDNLTFKVFVFQFINFYSSIFYIAFFKGRFVGYPGHYNHILGLRNEDCAAGGCLVELAQQLAVIMIGKQMVNNAQEIILPKLKARWQNRQVKAAISTSNKSRWEEDYQLIDSEGLFQEYLEMVLQFGFITIFVAAFPLAPLFALLNNWVEIRLDAQKFLCETRRPVAERCANIGIWFTILETLAHLAVISNAFLIAFTSEFLPKMLYQYEMHWHLEGYVNFTMAYAPNSTDSSVPGDCRYRGFRDENGKFTTFYWRLLAVRLGFVILFEHVVFFCCKMIDLMVPDVPESLSLKMKRERYLAKQALADASAVGTGGGDEEKDDPAEPQQQPSETVVHLAGPDQVERTAL